MRARLEAELEAAVSIHHKQESGLGVSCDELNSDFRDLKDAVALAMPSPSLTPKRGAHLPESAAQRSARIVGAAPPCARPTRSSTAASTPATPKRAPGLAGLRSASGSRERSSRNSTPLAFGSSRPREQQRAQQKGDMFPQPAGKHGLRGAASVGVADRSPPSVARLPSRLLSASTVKESLGKASNAKPGSCSSPRGVAGQQACHTTSSGRLASKSASPPPEKFPSRRSLGARAQGHSQVGQGPRMPASISPTRRSPSQLGLPPPPATAPPPVGLQARHATPRRRSLPSPPRDAARTSSVPKTIANLKVSAPSAPSARAPSSDRRGGSARCPPGAPEEHGAPLALLHGPAGEWKAQLPEDLRAKVVTKCPQGHELQTFATLADTYPCSVCRKKLSRGSAMFGCRRCSYDVCGECFQRVTAILLSLSNGGGRVSPSACSLGDN